MNVTCTLMLFGSSAGCKSIAGQRLQKAAPIKLFFYTLHTSNICSENRCRCHLVRKGKNENEKAKNKKGNQTKPDGICQADCSPLAYQMSRGRYVPDEGIGAGRLQSARDRG